MTSEAVAYRLFHAYIRPYYQPILNIYPILAKKKQEHFEALNRQIFRKMHLWYDATVDEINNLPKYKSIGKLTHAHRTRLVPAILGTNPAVLCDLLQHKMYLLYIYEYYHNPVLLKEKRTIMNRGRTSERITQLFHQNRSTPFDYVLCR